MVTHTTFAPGRLVAERYRLEAPVGQGGMGTIWRARDLVDGGDVALKLIHAPAGDEVAHRSRFRREAEVLAALHHPHIVEVRDHGTHLGVPYLAMELLTGQSLAQRLRVAAPLPPSEVARVVQQIGEGLAAAHDAGITHRDLKPDNIFLVQSPGGLNAKLLDFGVARRHDPLVKAGTLTQTGLLVGTPHYMSPEHVDGGRAVTARSDLWSLGVVAFECMTGVQPFRGENFLNLLVAICVDPIPLPSTLGPVPPGFDEWFLQACRRDATERFTSARAMVSALLEIVEPATAGVVLTGDPEPSVDPADGGVSARGSDARSSLPVEATEFIGRTGELARVARLLAEQRVVTLLGPGGIGKTRLAVRVADTISSSYRDGVVFVPLAPIRDPSLVLSTVAGVLGVLEQPSRPLHDVLVEHLSGMQLLLVCDNLEHVIAAAPELAALQQGAPDVDLLITSRTATRIAGEVVFPVGPLQLPERDGAADGLLDNEAVALFVSRAVQANPDLALAEDTLRTIADLVSRLDGLPLAIELAAARTRLYPPDALLRQLGTDGQLLTEETGDVARRHRAMRDVIAWSYNLLEDDERALFRRLSVFTGGCTAGAADRVALGPPVRDVAQGMWSLTEKSLLVHEAVGGQDRWHMLESIREFAAGELDRVGESDFAHRRHLDVFGDLVLECEPQLRRHDAGAVHERLADEDGNLRTALHFALHHSADRGLQMAARLWRYWQGVGRLQEGRRWLVELLARTDVDIATRAHGLTALAGLAYWQADYETAAMRYRQALDIFRDLGDRFHSADSLLSISQCAVWSGDAATGERLAGEALDIFEEIDAREQVGMALMAQGFARWMRGDLTGARPLWEESLGIARDSGDDVEAAHKMLALASITFQEGDIDRAIDDSLTALNQLYAHENVALTVMAIDWIAALTAERAPDAAARLAGAATALRAGMGGGMRPVACGLPDARRLAAEQIGRDAAERAFTSGRTLALADAVLLARSTCTRVAV